jgi:hypothetical protein
MLEKWDEDMDMINLAQDRDQWHALVNMVNKHEASKWREYPEWLWITSMIEGADLN